MAKTSKMQQYAIQWLDSQNYSVAEIVNELNLSEKTVIGVLEKNKNPNTNAEPVNIKTGSESVAPAKGSKNLMINQTAVKKNNSVMIMTPEASMKNDEAKKKINDASTRQTHSAIFRPNVK